MEGTVAWVVTVVGSKKVIKSRERSTVRDGVGKKGKGGIKAIYTVGP